MPKKEKTVQTYEVIDGSKIPICQAGQTTAKPIHTEEDKKGNKFEIFCKNGAYQGTFTPKGGKPVFVGKCKYPRGHNDIFKKLLSKITTGWKMNLDTGVIDYDAKIVACLEIQEIMWKSIGPVGPPPTTGTKPYGAMGDGEDMLWIYDVKSNNITTQKTKHTGHWVLDDPNADRTKIENWSWVVSEQEADGEPTKKQAPSTPDGLGMRIGGPHPFCDIASPGRFSQVSVAPFTIMIEQEPHTLTFELPVGSEKLKLERVEATEDEPFRLEIMLPNKEERLLRFALLDAPSGMAINRNTGVITWKPKANQIGTHRVVVVHRYHELSPHIDEFILLVDRGKQRRRLKRKVSRVA